MRILKEIKGSSVDRGGEGVPAAICGAALQYIRTYYLLIGFSFQCSEKPYEIPPQIASLCRANPILGTQTFSAASGLRHGCGTVSLEIYSKLASLCRANPILGTQTFSAAARLRHGCGTVSLEIERDMGL